MAPTPSRRRVDAAVELRLVVPAAEAVRLPVRLRYCADDPYAVRAVFAAGDGPGLEWVFGRDLLVEALERPSGEGDVQAWPVRRGDVDVLALSLTSPDGHALLEGDAVDIAAFLARTLALVPAGAESTLVDLDLEITALLTG